MRSDIMVSFVTLSSSLLPGLSMQIRRDDEVPVAHQFAGLAAFQVVGLLRPQLTQRVQVPILN
jgi:hypothetical protein